MKVSRVDQENGVHQVYMESQVEEVWLDHQDHQDIVNSVILLQDIPVAMLQNIYSWDEMILRGLKNIRNLIPIVILPVASSRKHSSL